ncbi:MAG: hypothetical protein AseanaTS_16640 [Candidatus Pelagadaptatus aseana]|uniref:beta-lactamase hydrolase domain-containing protein n=1 Tax=Candidatus Pelagadaptatus aseana TaxID=3120508 RepID=UPI0039B315E8
MSDLLSKMPGLSMPFASQPYDNIICGGQPGIEDYRLMKTAGIDNVINMRMPGEHSDFNDQEQASAAGLTYVAMPIAGEPAITLDAARQLDEVLAGLDGNTLVHCASSNRVGALFAIRAAVLQGKPLEDAVAEGQAAGLKALLDRTLMVIESA